MSGCREMARGAEAVIEETTWFGKKAVRKRRLVKGYRREDLDRELRVSRTKSEARLLIEARDAGFPTPHIFDVDLSTMSITMEYIEGQTLKDFINESQDHAGEICRDVGRYIGLLHKGGMVHGDLTTSNVIVSKTGLCFIDMGLGGKAQGIEDMGVDLHLVKEALESTHNHIDGLYEKLIEGYHTTFSGSRDVEERTKVIESRGRYT